MLTSARSNGCRFVKSSDSGSRPSATEMFFIRRPNFPFGECRSCHSTSFRFTLRMWDSFGVKVLSIIYKLQCGKDDISVYKVRGSNHHSRKSDQKRVRINCFKGENWCTA